MSRLTLGLLLLAARAASAAPVVTVEVEPPTLVLGDAATVTFTVKTGARGKGRFEPPEWRGLQVLGRSTQSRTQIVNFEVSQAFLYTFEVRPERAGVLVIGPARYADSTGNARSRPYNLRVGDAKAPTPDGEDGAAALGRVDLAVVAEAEPAEAVPGQQILLTYTLFTRIRINEYAMEEPELQGFWKEDVPVAKSLRFQRRVVNGQAYDAAVLRRYLLFPIEPGSFTVPAVPVEVQVSTGFLSSKRKRRRSNAVTIDVQPRPDGAPPGYSGAVGRFKLTSKLDRKGARVGEPLALRLELSGFGNFKGFSLQPPPMPDGLRTHPATREDDARLDGGRLVGRKVIEQILIPLRAGRFTLPAVEVSYYDPARGKYAVARARAIRLRVQPRAAGAPAVAPTHAPSVAAPVEIEVPTLRPLHTAPELVPRRRRRPPWSSWWFWAALGLPPLAFLGLLARDRVRARRSKTEDQRVMRHALRRARRRLRDADDYVRESRADKVYGELARALIGYIDDRTGGRTAGLTIQELGAHLEAAGYPATEVAAVLAELEHCDHARFSAAGATPDEMASSLARLDLLLKRLDRHMPAAGRGGAR